MTATLPDWTKDTIDNYINRGLSPGSFCRALFANDLMMTYAYADMWSRDHMYDLLCYVRAKVPPEAKGSYRKVDNWINKFNNKDEHGN
jgi:hypothetical protein